MLDRIINIEMEFSQIDEDGDLIEEEHILLGDIISIQGEGEEHSIRFKMIDNDRDVGTEPGEFTSTLYMKEGHYFIKCGFFVDIEKEYYLSSEVNDKELTLTQRDIGDPEKQTTKFYCELS